MCYRIEAALALSFAGTQDGGGTKGQMKRASVIREPHLPLLLPFIIHPRLPPVGMRVAAES